jgi:hypothetical protein
MLVSELLQSLDFCMFACRGTHTRAHTHTYTHTRARTHTEYTSESLKPIYLRLFHPACVRMLHSGPPFSMSTRRVVRVARTTRRARRPATIISSQ